MLYAVPDVLVNPNDDPEVCSECPDIFIGPKALTKSSVLWAAPYAVWGALYTPVVIEPDKCNMLPISICVSHWVGSVYPIGVVDWLIVVHACNL